MFYSLNISIILETGIFGVSQHVISNKVGKSYPEYSKLIDKPRIRAGIIVFWATH